MIAKAVIAHQIPGRVRLVIPDKRGDAAYFKKLSDEFSRVESVKKAKVNPITGSLILEFTDGLWNVVQRVRIHDLFSVDAVETDQQPPVSLRVETNPVNLVSGRKIDSMFMVGSALGAVGLLQTARGQILAPAITLVWYAIEAFRQSGNPIDTR